MILFVGNCDVGSVYLRSPLEMRIGVDPGRDEASWSLSGDPANLIS